MNWKVNSLYIALMTGVTFLVWAITAGGFMALTGSDITTQTDAATAGSSTIFLLVASFAIVLILAWFINRTRLRGTSLALQVFIMFFGTIFFMSQIETLYFIDAVAMPMPVLAATLGSGFLVVLALAGQSVLFRRSLGTITPAPPAKVRSRLAKFIMLSPVYLAIYFLFGYFVAWQIPEIRQYYTGSSDIAPFIDHMKSVLSDDSWLPLFQLIRGLLWAAIAYSIAVSTIRLRSFEKILMIAFALSVPIAIPLLLPNPYMPDAVRMAHFYEVLSSQFLFGLIAGWLFRAAD